jgi:DNA-binding beta-propeller fold protein YncE
MRRLSRWRQALTPTILVFGAIALTHGSAFAATRPLYTYTFSVGDSQSTADAVLFDGKYIWVAYEGRGAGYLQKLDETGQVLSTTTVGRLPIELAYDGANVWVSNYDSSSISIVNAQGELVKTIFLPVIAHPEGILFDGKYVWTANNGSGANNISKFDAASMTLIANYTTGNNPDDVAFDGTYIWVTNSNSNNVVKLNRDTGEILRTYPTGDFPLSIIFDGKDMWIGNGAVEGGDLPPIAAGSLTELRAYGGVNLGTFAVGNAVRGLVYDGTSIWACNSLSNTFTIIRVADGANLGTYPVGAAPRDIAFDGVRMWIANSGGNTVTIVTPSPKPVVLSPAIGYYIPEVEIVPTPLKPIKADGSALATPAAITPRVAPSVAALNGILDVLLDNN